MGKLDSNSPTTFSFSGCGFLGIYHIGVAACLREYGPISPQSKFLGASAGSLIAMALACDMPLGTSTTELLHVAMKARARALGPFHPSFDINKILYEILMRMLPDDAYQRANGRAYISLTRVNDGKNVIINKFKSNEELIKAVQCSCFIPLWSGLIPPKFNGISYIDGGASDNLPVYDENTITVSPFAGEAHISPQDDTYSLFQINFNNSSISLSPGNFYRISRILFPAHPEVLSKMCQQGFDDCLKFLQQNQKISCTRCLAINFTLEKEAENKTSKHIHLDKHSMENCKECEYRRQIALLDSLPESVSQAIQDACDQVNKGIINWLFRHNSMQLLSILSIPYLLPIDVTVVIFSKIYEKLPDIQTELKASFMRFISFLQSLIVKIERKDSYSAKFSCQMAVKEFDYGSEENLSRIRRSSSFSTYKPPFVNYEEKINVKELDMKKPLDLEKSRKISYAGHETDKHVETKMSRRKSMIEIGNTEVLPPERVISELNFDFKLDMKDSKTPVDTPDKSRKDSKILDIDINEIDQTHAIEIANKALDWEKELLEKCHDQLDSDQNFDKMFEITRKNDALMAYYYTDENNKVKFTELFKIKDEDMKKMDDTEDESNDKQQKDSDDGLLENGSRSSEDPNKKQHRKSLKSLSED